ncbi:DndE family protein [Heliobacterium gestii]|uniref:DndE family protein n=1 Tax=Heliomicrobium gestii TaxID=2699 RepID=A0A845LB85_HELGE|nr:DndE family protein [Heliomicrobium gestii]MBM7865680.1 DNA sulfur modification protein DndE [Heliomicrobium gestii]MZP41929.1 DndE family protein [Heliomicrobium gestii]
MIFRLKTSKKTMDCFTEIGQKTGLKPFALAKLAIAIALNSNFDSLSFRTDTNGLDLNRQTITGEYDAMYKCLIEQHCGNHLCEDDYFPTYVKAYIDHGSILLHNQFRYGNDFILNLAGLEGDSI